MKQEIPRIIGKRFKEYTMEELLEVYDWYHEELLCDLLGMGLREYLDAYDGCKLKLENRIREKYGVDDIRKRWNAMFVLDVYNDYILSPADWYSRDIVISVECISDQVLKDKDLRYIKDDVMRQFYVSNIEQFLDHAKEFDGTLFADVMEWVFDAQYLFFREFSIDNAIEDILKEEGLCSFACCHMG